MAENIYERTSGLTADKQSVQFTSIVVTYNEARRLRECLRSLSFCDQLLVVDLGSTDGSVEIAYQCGAELIHYHRAPIVEQVLPNIMAYVRYPWVVRLDPDEVFSSVLVADVMQLITTDVQLAMISLPHQYYFRGIPLRNTPWGGIHYKPGIFHKDKVCLQPYVHRGLKTKIGYKHVRIEARGNNLIQHYWIDTYRQLFEKHWRYIKQEGPSQYHAGRRFRGWRGWLRDTRYALYRSFVRYEGYKGGWRGLFLSFFYVWYVSASALSLWWYERQLRSTDDSIRTKEGV